jgi:hypothetical protein
MDVAMLAGRFRVERTPEPTDKGVGEKLPAFITEMKTLHAQPLKPGLAHLKRYLFGIMPASTINGSEKGKDPEVLCLFLTQMRFCLISRDCHIVK